MEITRRVAALVGTLVVGGGVCAFAAAPAGAAVTVGETFPPAGVFCSPPAPGLTIFVTASPPAPAAVFSAPNGGVITSWSVQTGASVPVNIRFRVGRAAGGNDWTTVGESDLRVVAASQVNTYLTRVPVNAGDVIGFTLYGGSGIECGRGMAGYTFSFASSDVGPGTTATFISLAGVEAPVAAQLEPDADNDGYGDETQDLCPSDDATQKACRDKAAPETTITKKPKKKSKAKKANFEFTSSEPGSTFRCSIDGKPFEVCGSPKTYRVKPGRHSFVVFAKDAAGNVDDTPATASWTVKKKKRR
jgi:hypothetical protein